MKNQELEQKIRTAVEHAAPNQLDRILSSCDSHNEKGSVIHMTEQKKLNSKKKYRWAAIVAAAAMILLLLGVSPLLQNTILSSSNSLITLDVNPSLSLYVNSRERVLSVEARNTEAEDILEGMELEGTSLETAVNAIIGSMLQKGYLNELRNSILVSVEHEDASSGEQLQQKVSQLISSATQNSALDSAVLSQTITNNDDELAALAETYQISLGKAALIQEVIAQDSTMSFEELASLSINELALIISTHNLSSQSLTQTGTASDKAYIGDTEALNIACNHAGIANSDILEWEIELDSENHIMVYEVEFQTSSGEYEYDINATTGEIVSFGRDSHSNNQGTSNNASYIGEEAATAAALAHANVTEADTVYLNCYMEYDDGRAECYQVEFMVANTRYEYEIDLYSTAVLEYHVETYSTNSNSQPNSSNQSDSNQNSANQNNSNNTSYIGEEAALSIVLEDSGMDAASLTKKEIKLDKEDGRMVYEIELDAPTMECDYKIDALTGTIVEKEREQKGTHSPSTNSGSYIGEAAALSVVLNDIGLSESNLTKREIELDDEDGRMVYEIELEAGNMEYEYQIDALTGSILEAQTEVK